LTDDFCQGGCPRPHDSRVARDQRKSPLRVRFVDDLAKPRAFGHGHGLLVAAHAEVPQPSQQLGFGAKDRSGPTVVEEAEADRH
jgi:hypothetical protein